MHSYILGEPILPQRSHIHAARGAIGISELLCSLFDCDPVLEPMLEHLLNAFATRSCMRWSPQEEYISCTERCLQPYSKALRVDSHCLLEGTGFGFGAAVSPRLLTEHRERQW